nr:glycosyltransferase family 4 protein [Methanothermobacter sp. K4]
MQNYIGGPQVRVVSVAEKLLEEGIETVICAPLTAENPLEKYARAHGLEFEGIFMPGIKEFRGFREIVSNLIWILSIPLTVIQVMMIIKRNKIDVVHVNGVLNFQAALAGYICRKKVVWHLMSSMYPSLIISVMMPLVRRIADHVIVIAEGLADYYRLKGDYTVIYEPVDPERFSPAQYKGGVYSVRRSLGLSPSDTVAACVANINPVKGYEHLIVAVSEIVRSVPNFRLLAVGDVPATQRGYYERLLEMRRSLGLEDVFLFLGRRDDIPDILAASDIFVLPSIAEGTPISIIEAMAMGKPIVASRVGAVDEQVIDGVNGFLVEPASPGELAARIVELALDPNLRESMGRASGDLVGKFALEACVRAHKKIYTS